MSATMSTVRNRMRKLSSQIFVAQLVILTATVAVGFALFARAERGRLDSEYESRAAAIAETVAGVPEIRACMAVERPGCADVIQGFASETRHQTLASYVVVIDMNGVRHSHPNRALIGRKVEEPIVVRDGKVHYTIDHGSTGPSANARAPLYGTDGTLVGEVSVGIPESSVSSALWHELPSFAAWFAIALGIGALASWGLARHLKHRTFGLELDEISRLLQEREATLHGIREGVIAFGPDGHVNVVNDEARRLLNLKSHGTGAELTDLVPAGRLRDVLAGDVAGRDLVVLTEEHCLVVNRMPVTVQGRELGAVATLSDRTEQESLLRELDSVRGLTDALRAQQHEFGNRVHTLAGMLELGHYKEATDYAVELSGMERGLAGQLQERLDSTQLVGLLVAKSVVAAERGVTVVLTGDSRLDAGAVDTRALLTVVGNLVDNAVDAVGSTADGRVEVRIEQRERELCVEVRDNGPGVPPEVREAIFLDGYSTKAGNDGRRRGLGLALVQRVVRQQQGRIEVAAGPGGTFRVTLPVRAPRAVLR
jgi:two-component system CitB family sensor kinase